MRTLIPILSVILALIAAGSIAYVAWELTSDKPSDKPSGSRADEEDGDPADEQGKNR